MTAARVLTNKAGLSVVADLVEILTRETVRDGTFKTLARDGLRIPAEGKERVLAGIAAIAPLLTVHSAIGGTEHLAEPVESDTR
ncbi:MAG: hypothetical protein ACUVT0_00915, partial [Thermochromatium sp.]